MDGIVPDLTRNIPLISITVLSLVLLLTEAFLKKSEGIQFWMTVIGLLGCVIMTFPMLGESGTAFNGMVTVGGVGSFFGLLFLVSALFTVILSRDYLRKLDRELGEYYLLVLFATIGMMLMASAADLVVIFLGLELMSICLYILAGFFRSRPIANESSLKYFLLGAFATGFLLYGIALLYGVSGTTSIPVIVAKFPELTASPLLWGGLGLIMVGFAFKIGAVPFHMWVPDVYEGSPTPISGFMATGAKAAAFAAFMTVFAHQFGETERLRTAIAVLAAASMVLGNIVALMQSNVKRMLAYSSIAHAGYMLTGLAAANQLGWTGIMFYLLSYMFMNIGAFGIVALIEKEEEKNLTFEDYAGLGSKRPFLAALMAVFMFSLAGIPPFAGFFGKYYVFVAAIDSGLTWLAILGVLTSVISVYYYLRLVVLMYFRETEIEFSLAGSKIGVAVLLIAALALLQLGVFPSTVIPVLNTLF